jgi:CRISPR/Cas system-associated endoribonuclease Cas2
MSIVVITTQYMENYAAPEWDGVGTCPQYWKYKGGSTYWAPLKDGEDAQRAKANLAARVSESNDFVRIYPIGQAEIRSAAVLDEPHDDHEPVDCLWCEISPNRTTKRSDWIEVK